MEYVYRVATIYKARCDLSPYAAITLDRSAGWYDNAMVWILANTVSLFGFEIDSIGDIEYYYRSVERDTVKDLAYSILQVASFDNEGLDMVLYQLKGIGIDLSF
mgnify:CR=1 FL=1